MKKTNTNAVVFTQEQKAVVANKYVAHELYVRNKEIIEKLGGEIVKGVGGFRAEFKRVADAKKFVAEAICEISTKEYNAARKVTVEKPKTSCTQ